MAADGVTLIGEASQLCLLLEAAVIHLQAGDHTLVLADPIPVDHGWNHVIPVIDGVAPEVGAPGLVEGLDRAVLLLKPDTEGAGTALAVTQAAATAVLVAHMPGHQARGVGIAFGQMACQCPGCLSEVFTGGAEVVPPTENAMPSLLVGPDHLWVGSDHPGGQGRRPRSHDDVEPVLDQEDHDLIQHGEVISVFRRLQEGPGEDVDGGFVDVGVLEFFDVLFPGVLRPLFRIPIAPEQEAAECGFHD